MQHNLTRRIIQIGSYSHQSKFIHFNKNAHYIILYTTHTCTNILASGDTNNIPIDQLIQHDLKRSRII